MIAGTGQLHVEVVVNKLKKRYKVDVDLHQPKVPYRETITGSAEVTTRAQGATTSKPPPRQTLKGAATTGKGAYLKFSRPYCSPAIIFSTVMEF